MVSSFNPTDDYAERIRKLFSSTNGYNEQNRPQYNISGDRKLQFEMLLLLRALQKLLRNDTRHRKENR